MQIAILRHGKVDYPPLATLSAADFAKWVHLYNCNPLDPGSVPDNKTIMLASNAGAVACSTLPRSLESAKRLGCNDIQVIDPVFDEAGLPIAGWKFPVLSVRIWVILFRLAWFLGYSANSETVSQARLRAARAAEILEKLAGNHGSVLFVGHGLMNRMIAKRLLMNGWRVAAKPGSGYWDYGIFHKKD